MILKDASQVTLDYLRRTLAQQGEVAAFTVEQTQATHALVARVHITYTTKNGTAPEAMFLKCVPAGDSFGSSEVNYYRRDYLGLSDIPIPMCYDAAYDSATGAYHLLLQNLSDTHHNNHGTAPTLGYGLTLAEALARLHAPYFSAGALAHIGEYQPDEPKMQRYVDVMTLGIEPMLAAVSADITPQQHQLVRDVAHYHPRLLLDRVNDPTGLTLVHGDANPGNILSPKSGTMPIYLIDRQPFDWSLTVWLGVSDLAYAMVHWWDTPLRREFEIPVLRRYHHALNALGITNAWDDLWRDYRLCALQSLYVAANWCVDPAQAKSMRWVWWPQLQKTLAALEDLQCADLWDS